MSNKNSKLLRQILNDVLCGIYIYDFDDGAAAYMNQRFLRSTGYGEDQLRTLIKEGMNHLLHPDDLHGIMSHMDELAWISDDTFLEIEYRFKHASGRWIWCLSRDRVFKRRSDGSVKQFLATVIDITNKKHLEIELTERCETLQRRLSQQMPETAYSETEENASDPYKG